MILLDCQPSNSKKYVLKFYQDMGVRWGYTMSLREFLWDSSVLQKGEDIRASSPVLSQSNCQKQNELHNFQELEQNENAGVLI